MEARRPLYEEVATTVVSTSDKEPATIVAEIVESLA
jgi:shikimate kinase